MKNLLNAVIMMSLITLTGCSKSSEARDAKTKTHHAGSEPSAAGSTKPTVPVIAPEDNPALKGTPVLGFKLGDSTVDSVKARLRNHKVSENTSYADGPLLENDGSGFDIDGLQYTQFGFDTNNKLVSVGMSFRESNKMGHDTYKKLVAYVKERNYKVVRVVAPFVGNQFTEFSTPSHDIITVASPHLDFNVYVEYVTQAFDKARSDYRQQQSSKQQNKESQNF